MKLGCLDFNFSYLPFPASAAKLGTYSFMALARLGIARRYRYARRSLELISRLGFEGAQVMCQDVKQMPMKAEQLSALCSDLNIAITSLGGYMDFFDSGVMERFESVIDYAAASGAGIVCTHSGRGNDIKIMVENMASAVDYASSHGIIIALENSPLHSIATADGVLALIREIPGLRVNLDPANFALSGVTPAEAAEELKKYIVHAHAKDVKGLSFVPVGKGDVPWEQLIRALRGYGGFMVIEHEGSGNPLTETLESKSYLENLMKKL